MALYVFPRRMSASALECLAADRFPLGFESGFDLSGTFTLFSSLKGTELPGSGDLFLACSGREVGLKIMLIDKKIDNPAKRRDGGLGSEIHFGASRADHKHSEGIAVPFVVVGKSVETAVVLFAVAVLPLRDVCRTGFAADFEAGVLGPGSGTAFDNFLEDSVDPAGSRGADCPVVTVFGFDGVPGPVGIGYIIENAWGDGDAVIVECAVGFEHLGEGNGHAVSVGLVGTVDFAPEAFGRFDRAVEFSGEIDTAGAAESESA